MILKIQLVFFSFIAVYLCGCSGLSEPSQNKLIDLNFVYKPPAGVTGSGELEILDYYRDDFDYLVLTGRTKPNTVIHLNEYTYNSNERGYFKIKANIIARRKIVVRALTENGNEIGYTEIEDFDAPDAPSGLEIVSVDINRIEIRWNENREPDLYGYNIYLNQKNTGWKKVNHSDEIITKNEYTISRLHSGMNYKIRITAYDKLLNESSPSEEKNANTLGESSDCCNK